MKKLALLLSLALLAACGGGGGGTTSSTGSQTQSGPSGSLSVRISEPVAKLYTLTTDGSVQTWRRIVISNPSLNYQGKYYQVYKDFDRNNPPALTFSLPYSTGYLIEVLDYDKPTSVFTTYSANTSPAYVFSRMSSAKAPFKPTAYGKANFDFLSGGATTVNITLRTVANRLPTVTYNSASIPSVISGQTYSASISGAAFVNMSSTPFTTDTWGFKEGLTVAAADVAPIRNVSGSLTAYGLMGPFTLNNGVDSYYGIGTLYVKNSLLLRTGSATEPYNTFINFTQPTGAVPVTVPGGTLTVQ